ncbi:MAG: VWA domain-containing protein [Chloroflexus sp.]|uniref:VWA domain-containing protein n=1 Tax=Chloroflexus sp. TaxID=1904827 RepID=UPI0021DD6608|nr:VWA domain-containing protein [Chloroflexus sp.]GIV89336.1 MAG: VWA domain-containing protein [Chloroflexus sp.]
MIWQAPHMFWLLLALPALVLIWRRAGRRLPWRVVVLRLTILTLLIGALANPVRQQADTPATGPLLVIYDQSDSLTPAGQAAIRAEAEAIAAAAGPQTRLLAFGANVVAGNERMPDGAGSDLAQALRTARQLLPSGGRVILIGDGHNTGGDVLAEAQRAAAAGIRVDVRFIAAPAAPEIAVTRLDAPALVRSGEPFDITVTTTYQPIDDPTPIAADLRIWVDEQLLGEESVVIPPGQYQFTITHTAEQPGLLSLRTEIIPTGNDTFAANNVAAATALVMPPPRILLVEGSRDNGAVLGAALTQAGMEVERVSVSAVPGVLNRLAMYDGIVLVDVSANQLSFEQMTALREVVRSEGKGLTVIGGNQSFTLGGYARTPLAEALPLLMEPPPRPQRAPISLLLIIDRSASMSASFGVSKFDLAKEAAILALTALQAGDRIGILAFDTDTIWTIPFQAVGKGTAIAELQTRIATMAIGGGTNIERALAVGLPALAAEPHSVRHAVLLTDGRSYSNNYPRYQQLVETARAAQITLSTIAIGTDADTDLLDQLARWGNGRYYFVPDAADLPRITLQESEIAGSELTVEQPSPVRLNQPHPLVRNFDPSTLPLLDGYIALQSRPEATVVLSSPADDPLLSVWQYGLGRSVAWTASAAAPWATRWPGWSEYDRFWNQVIQYTIPTPDSGPLQVWVEPLSRGIRLMVDAQTIGGVPIDLAQVNAQITFPDQRSQRISLLQIGPGRYSRDVALGEVGPYRVVVALFADGQTLQRSIGYVQAPPTEYAIHDPAQGAERLRQIAAITGGSTEVVVVDEASVAMPASPQELWPWLAALALALWVGEIALRRNQLYA